MKVNTLLILKRQKSFIILLKHTETAELTKIETPHVKTAQELADFLNRPLDEIVKTMIFKVDGEFIMVLIRGHHELNDVKLKSFLEQTM